MQRVIPLPVLYRSLNLNRIVAIFTVARAASIWTFRLASDVVRLMFQAPPEQERIENLRARYTAISGHSV